jgi:hypothetical protein
MRTRYLGKDDRVVEHQGSFTWEENGNVIHLNNFSEGPDRYHLHDEEMVLLLPRVTPPAKFRALGD